MKDLKFDYNGETGILSIKDDNGIYLTFDDDLMTYHQLEIDPLDENYDGLMVMIGGKITSIEKIWRLAMDLKPQYQNQWIIDNRNEKNHQDEIRSPYLTGRI